MSSDKLGMQAINRAITKRLVDLKKKMGVLLTEKSRLEAMLNAGADPRREINRHNWVWSRRRPGKKTRRPLRVQGKKKAKR